MWQRSAGLQIEDNSVLLSGGEIKRARISTTLEFHRLPRGNSVIWSSGQRFSFSCCIKTTVAENGILFSAMETFPDNGENTTASFSES